MGTLPPKLLSLPEPSRDVNHGLLALHRRAARPVPLADIDGLPARLQLAQLDENLLDVLRLGPLNCEL